jgi:Sporulation initiation factor Spo0A C terminal.
VRNEIVLYLLTIGVKPHYKGFNYLVSSLVMTLNADSRIPMLEIYNAVAREYDISSQRVERCIRTLVSTYYQTMSNPPVYKYTNSEFIYLCTMHMKTHIGTKEG